MTDEGSIDIGRTDAASLDVLSIELELRRIVGVVSARVERSSDDGALSVSLAVVGNASGASDAANSALRAYYDGPVDIDVIELSAAPRPDAPPATERVRVIDVRTSENGGQVEVRLAHGSRQAVGRTADRRLIGVARATMSALRSLGADLPFEIEAVTNLGAGADGAATTGPVVVLVRSLDSTESGNQRLGVVRGRDGQQATVRALLHALNRHLERALAPPDAQSRAAHPALASH